MLNNYIAIRFSLRWSTEWAMKAYGDETNRESWFAMRSTLFKQWVVPAIAAQTVPVKRVIVFMDSDDQRLWRRYLRLSAPFSPVFVRGGEARQREMGRLIREDRARDVVLSRLDSDDAIAPNFLEEINKTVVQARAHRAGPLYVVAANGFTTDLSGIQFVHYNCSPFISVYVSHYAHEDIYDIEHTQILKRSPLINSSAIWLQVVHGTNLLNKLHNEPRYTNRDDARLMVRGPIVPASTAWPIGFLPLYDPRGKSALASDIESKGSRQVRWWTSNRRTR